MIDLCDNKEIKTCAGVQEVKILKLYKGVALNFVFISLSSFLVQLSTEDEYFCVRCVCDVLHSQWFEKF